MAEAVKMEYRVETLRAAGLHAKWSRTSAGAPILCARDPESKNWHQRKVWWLVSRDMWAAMQKEGVREAFDRHTLLGDFFSIPA